MSYRFAPGLGIVQPADCAQPWCIPGKTDCSAWSDWMLAPACWGSLPSTWGGPSAVAPPPAPPIVLGTVSTLPAGTQDTAQQTVDALIAQQGAAQQAQNAAGVDSSLFDLAAGGAYSAGSAVGSGLAAVPWWGWALGAAVVGLVVVKAVR